MQLDIPYQEFLQAMMSHGIMNGRQVKETINGIIQRHQIDTDFASYISGVIGSINKNIEPYNIQIKKCICEVRGTNFYALVNLTEHPVNLLSPYFSPPQLELYKKVIEEVVRSENGTISSLTILNFDFPENVKFSRKEREEAIGKMVDDKWLVEEEGEVSLSARSIYEMEVYIKEVHKEDIRICPPCNSLIIRGQQCENEDCGVRIHNHCAKKFFKPGVQRKCPKCKADWQDASQSQSQAGSSSATVGRRGC